MFFYWLIIDFDSFQILEDNGQHWFGKLNAKKECINSTGDKIWACKLEEEIIVIMTITSKKNTTQEDDDDDLMLQFPLSFDPL